MKKDQYLKILKGQKEIKDLLVQLILLVKQNKCDCLDKQMNAVEEMHGFGAPALPYDPDNYEMPPRLKDDSIFKPEEELWDKKKRSYECPSPAKLSRK